MASDCVYNGETFSDGSQVCQGGEIHRCDDGAWTNLHWACPEGGLDASSKILPYPVWLDTDVKGDLASVRLCTGERIEISKASGLKFVTLGESGEGEHRVRIAKLVVDVTNPSHTVVEQLVRSIAKLTEQSSVRETALLNIHVERAGTMTKTPPEKPSEFELKDTATQIAVPCLGTACANHPEYAYYDAPSDIISFAINRAEGCNVLGTVKIGNRRLRVQHAAIGGTICGYSYSGKAYYDVALA